ncbi:Thyrotropin-releasing hormone-degrading ectoenzyme [Nibea albiflora]|uniref:Thyrotropin-releasing hormone-degrading ectoenzyme n=1 Tax=Nibea albiflora TaxID=240163 RepID=A0ACB7EUK1_NIBAL|nr:Thyrotropin-releasing hormone-degrading ectoenzyme [Nibea albiflora]
MPVESSSLADEDGWVTNRFARTPRMSTYYLAWAVCNFTYKETQTDGGVTIRLYARPDAISSGAGDYALHITKRLLGFYQDYFKVQYSLPKLASLFSESSRCQVEIRCDCGGAFRTAAASCRRLCLNQRKHDKDKEPPPSPSDICLSAPLGAAMATTPGRRRSS